MRSLLSLLQSWSKGTFTIGQVTRVLDEACKIGTVEWIYFEGGEPFLYYPLLLESVRRAAEERSFGAQMAGISAEALPG